jgi:hypothetical protein
LTDGDTTALLVSVNPINGMGVVTLTVSSQKNYVSQTVDAIIARRILIYAIYRSNLMVEVQWYVLRTYLATDTIPKHAVVKNSFTVAVEEMLTGLKRLHNVKNDVEIIAVKHQCLATNQLLKEVAMIK